MRGKFIISGGFIRRSLDICEILLPSMQPSEAPFDIPMKRILERDLQVSFKRAMSSAIWFVLLLEFGSSEVAQLTIVIPYLSQISLAKFRYLFL